MKKIFLLTLVIISVFIFSSCKKEESKELISEITENEIPDKQSVTILKVEISEKGWKGQGTGKDKTCVPGKNRCWIWKWFPDEVIIGGSSTIAIASNEDNISSSINSTKGILLDFKYKYNDKIALQELFDLTNNSFVINEDIIEENDSYLSELRGSSRPSKISAGTYSITEYSEGIKVILPVTDN